MNERRWARPGRGALVAVVAGIVALTLASLTFNAATTPGRTLDAPGGRDVQTSVGRIHYERWGEHGTPVVLVHGFAESTLAWSLTAPELARHHRVYALDLPGFGYSGYTGRYTLDDEVAALAAFLEALDIDRPILVGHSMGAGVVGELARRRPDLVSAVVFADGDALAFEGRDRPSRAAEVVVGSPYATSALRLGLRSRWVRREFFAQACGSVCPAATDELIDAWVRPMRQGAAENALRTMASQPMVAMTPQQVRQIRVPRGIVWGEEDTTSGGSLDGARAALGDPPTVVIPDAGHLPVVADPKGFAHALELVIDRMGTLTVEGGEP